MPSSFLLMAILVLSLSQYTSTLLIHVQTQPTNASPNTSKNDTYALTSYYSTLGTHPNTTIRSNLTFLSSSDIDDESCTIQQNKRVAGYMLVFTGLIPSMRGCNRDTMGRMVALALTAQRMGASALVLTGEEYMDGRLIGFNEYITLPVVVVSESVARYLHNNMDIILSMELTPISTKEQNILRLLGVSYTIWVEINTILYCILLVLLGFTICIDLERLYRKKKYFSHGVCLKLSAFASVMFSFMWIVVDPFGNRGYLWWHGSIVYFLYRGLHNITVLLVLRIWMLTPIPMVRIFNPTVVSRITYTICSVILLVSMCAAILWYVNIVLEIYSFLISVTLCVFGIGFVIYGKNFIQIFSRSGNVSPESRVLPVKIAVFIVIYIVVVYTSLLVMMLSPLGYLFGSLFVASFGALTYFAIFLILFFPTMEKRRRKQDSSRSIPLSEVSVQSPPKMELTTSSSESVPSEA